MLPLLWEGSELSRNRAVKTMEYAGCRQSKKGFFYAIVYNGEVHHDCGKQRGGKYHYHLIRRQGDMVYFLYKEIHAMQKLKMEIPPDIYESAQRAADVLVELWRTYMQLGQYVNAETGEILMGGSTAGGIVPAALCAAEMVTGNRIYGECAREIGEFYHREAIEKGVTNGGPGDILQAPDSESIAGLLESYTVLYDMDKNPLWLKYAEDAAAQLASWIVPYNYRFPEDSTFGRRKVGTVGSVWANVQNKHSAPGLCTLSAAGLWKVWRATGKREYLNLAYHVARFIPQVISRDGHELITTSGKTMPPGSVCERVNMSDWEGSQNVGGNIFGVSSWPEISMMLNWLELPGVYIDTESKIVRCADHVEARIEGDMLVVENMTDYDACVKVMMEGAGQRKESLGLSWQERMQRVEIPAGKSAVLSLGRDQRNL